VTLVDARAGARVRATVRDHAVPILLGGVATALGLLVPVAGPLLIALLLGAVVANLVAVPQHWSDGAKLALRWGVVLLGLKLPLDTAFGIGWEAIVTVLVTIAATYTGTLAIGRRLGADDDVTRLIAVGFSICGAAAIAAVEDTLQASRSAVATAIAMVTAWGSLMIAVTPLAANLLGLSDRQTGVWIGSSVHEVAQVVAAASVAGGTIVVAVATTTKLVRVVLLAPMHLVVSRSRDAGKMPKVPWFVLAFVAAIGVRSTGLPPAGVLDVGSAASLFLLAVGMVGLGLGVRIATLWPMSWRVVALSGASTVIALTVSGALVLALT
jgi:uncharacterized integral membrane protein (TIGR00698 family)